MGISHYHFSLATAEHSKHLAMIALRHPHPQMNRELRQSSRVITDDQNLWKTTSTCWSPRRNQLAPKNILCISNVPKKPAQGGWRKIINTKACCTIGMKCNLCPYEACNLFNSFCEFALAFPQPFSTVVSTPQPFAALLVPSKLFSALRRPSQFSHKHSQLFSTLFISSHLNSILLVFPPLLNFSERFSTRLNSSHLFPPLFSSLSASQLVSLFSPPPTSS